MTQESAKPFVLTTKATLIMLVVACSPIAAAAAGGIGVVDGDTIALGGITHRIHGIDAPEVGQSCARTGGGSWACGKAALEEMERLVLSAHHVVCDDRGPDGYGRQLSVCLTDGVDVGKQLVEDGLAWSFRKYSHDYDAVEAGAKAAKRGVWQTATEAPWDYRARQWNAGIQEAPDKRCPIKGNINKQGERIYHAPWSPWYAKTRVSVNQGERWFCDEAQAVAAGWRAPFWGKGGQ